MFEQTGKGILEKLKGASINLEEIPAPITNEAMAIYDAFLKKIEDAGVPITEPRAFLSVGEAGEREAEGWMKDADEQLKMWRKVRRRDVSILFCVPTDYTAQR